MHPMFVTLFIEADADDLLSEEQDRKRRAHTARRGRSARVIRVAANPDRPRPPDVHLERVEVRRPMT